MLKFINNFYRCKYQIHRLHLCPVYIVNYKYTAKPLGSAFLCIALYDIFRHIATFYKCSLINFHYVAMYRCNDATMSRCIENHLSM